MIAIDNLYSDLLHAHLRRHQKKTQQEVERRNDGTRSPKAALANEKTSGTQSNSRPPGHPARAFSPVGQLRETLWSPLREDASSAAGSSLRVMPGFDDTIGFANVELPFPGQYDMLVPQQELKVDKENSPGHEFPWLFPGGGFFGFQDEDYLDFEGLPLVQV